MKRVVVAIMIAALSCAACTRHGGLNRGVTYGSPTQVPIQDVPVKGFDVTVYTRDRTVSGELLAVDSGHVFVLKGDETVDFPMGDIYRISVTLYPSKAGWMLLWTLGGTASTLSHGLFLVFTAPTWLVVGGTTSVGSAAAAEKTVRPGAVIYLWQFSRFPAGLPASWPTHPPPPLEPAPEPARDYSSVL